jgi:hypothetical protein
MGPKMRTVYKRFT